MSNKPMSARLKKILKDESGAFKTFSWEEASAAFGPFNQNKGVHVALEIENRFNRHVKYEGDSIFKIAICTNDTVVMPEPKDGDSWSHGNFVATVIDVLDDKLIIVKDADDDCFTVEAERIEIETAA